VSQSFQQEAAPVPAGQPDLAGTQMKRRNPLGAWLGLPIITLGIYGLVWYYLVHSELAAFDRRRPVSAGLALCSVLLGTLTLGIWPLVTWVKLAGHIRNAQRAAGLEPSCSGGVGFLLGIIGFGVLYYQIELNKVVKHYGDAAPGSQVTLAA
jgi:Domain of unknown function (DUF4234)